MKKICLLIAVLFALISCTEDVRFNNPSFQATKDNVFWRAIQSRATLGPNGSIVIEAYTQNEIVTFKLDATAEKTYFLGTSESKKVIYEITDPTGPITFSTGFGIGNGQIVVTEYDQVNHTISGNFKFNAENTDDNPLAGPVVNFQYGVFYKIPVQ